MKKCCHCGIEKSILEFSKNASNYDGAQSECKSCRKSRNIIYKRTIPGLVATIHCRQVSRSKRIGMDRPNYTRLELLDWLKNNQHFDELYNNWVKNGYKKDDVPSIDRLDDYKAYSFDFYEKNGANLENVFTIIQQL